MSKLEKLPRSSLYLIEECIDREGGFSMSDESVPENKPAADKGHQSLASIWKESFADTVKVMDSTETVTGRPRHIVDAGLLGTCVVFLVAMLGLPQKQIDTPLTIALVAFVVSIPLLASGFMNAFIKVKHDVPGWRILEALLIGASVAEGFGWLAAAVGMFAVIFHLSLLAFNAFIAACVFVIVGVPFFSFVGLIIYAVVKYKKQQKEQDKTTSTASGDAPAQAQQTT